MSVATRVVNALALAALGGALIYTVAVLRDETRVVAMRDASVRQAAGLATSNDLQALAPAAPSADRLPARAALLRGVMRARAAANDPAHAPQLLAEARRDIAQAQATRPVWGEAEVARAYVELLDHGAESPQALSALAASYRAAPFLRDSAPWRIRFGVAVWPKLDAQTRDRLVSETAWLAGASGRTYAYALGLVAGSPAEPLVRGRIPS
ncbi:hypothetical protein [Sphingomonas fuzhouensis]|uniref:hypothetical protein n=1 Tax=Sphingomonas fuzhouensis TaxID=3106033 RepID=UPI002AFEC03C|nr:hypothetical protein [Sphingomonas sp. SGZ-02]